MSDRREHFDRHADRHTDPIARLERAVADLVGPDVPRIVVTVSPQDRLPFRVEVHQGVSPRELVTRLPGRAPSATEQAVLDLLSEGPLTAKQVATRLRVSYGYARHVLARCVRQRWIQRERSGYRRRVGNVGNVGDN